MELRDHLLLLGIGGSGVATLESGERVWDGFPVNDDLDLTVPYQLLASLSDDDSVILLTHAPASCLPSSRQQKSLEDTPILCGSDKLTVFFYQLLRTVYTLILYQLDPCSSIFAWTQSPRSWIDIDH